jgi:general secretion pathway protein H
MHSRSTRGFTLLELIVVLVIIGLMAVLVVPRLVGPLANLDLKTASQKISASLRYARSQAAAEKTTYVALFDFEKNRLVIINPPTTPAEPTNSEKDGPGGSKTYDLPGKVRLAKGTSREGEFHSGSFRIFFFPSGGSSGGEITVANERGRQYKITVDFITGTVRLAEVMV